MAVVHRRWRLIAGIAVDVWRRVFDGLAGAARRRRLRLDGHEDPEVAGRHHPRRAVVLALAGVVAITAAVTPWTSRRWRRAWWAARHRCRRGPPHRHARVARDRAGRARRFGGGLGQRRDPGHASASPDRGGGRRRAALGRRRSRTARAALRSNARGSTPYLGCLHDSTPVLRI